MEWHHIGLFALGLLIGSIIGAVFSALGNKIKREEELFFTPQYDRRKNSNDKYYDQFKPVRRITP
jgi:uncharacterized membrane-anchored protein YhcB (DUF1043 family)